MPTYQYACTDCGDRSEVVQRFTDEALTLCSACGGKLRKVFSPVGIVFKGSGFYRTDSRDSSASKALANSSSAATSNGESKDSGSSTTEKKAESSSGSSSASGAASNGSSTSSSSSTGSKVA